MVEAQLPPFSIQAAVSGRTVSPEALRGRFGVLVLHGPRSSDAAKEVGKAVRAQWPDARRVAVASVVDLRSMGGLWKRVAEAQIKSTYERMAAKVTLGDPADYVVICPDWDGKVGPAFGVAQPDAEPGVALLGPDGALLGVVNPPDLGLRVVERLKAAGA